MKYRPVILLIVICALLCAFTACKKVNLEPTVAPIVTKAPVVTVAPTVTALPESTVTVMPNASILPSATPAAT